MREGLVPAILGTAVATTGAALLKKNPAVGYGILGFGLAHLVLGAIDLIEHR
ncbi:asparagine synthase [Paenibacillus sp.]|uniref:asparagine synthase n=1 Tax=Paenibacillus sp. TaxID=58172 RepID=UPI002D282294|nr:asparagine synthase [Paenibacillus sp.]HZG58475.1 asparagine synthase [Paenibacillus sp.]